MPHYDLSSVCPEQSQEPVTVLLPSIDVFIVAGWVVAGIAIVHVIEHLSFPYLVADYSTRLWLSFRYIPWCSDSPPVASCSGGLSSHLHTVHDARLLVVSPVGVISPMHSVPEPSWSFCR